MATDEPSRASPALRAPHRAPAASSQTSSAKADIVVCRTLLNEGSKSFAAASRLLPSRIRDPAAVFYAFCRIADDLVDYSDEPRAAVLELHGRLDRIYADEANDEAVDRALGRVIHHYRLPRALFDAIIEGFAWDANDRVYEEFTDLVAYAARVASAVGVVMTLLMGSRDRTTLARACDLGVAMQLTNIARDVAEDATLGRIYLPRTWLREAGIDPEKFLAHPHDHPALPTVVGRLLTEADRLYLRADTGITRLPRDCRSSIRAARLIYADIARALRQQANDPMVGRARVSAPRKFWLLLCALARPTPPGPRNHTLETAEALEEVRFLIDAIAVPEES